MENDINVLTSTIRYNVRTHAYSAYDSALHWYSIPAERVKAYAVRFGITQNEAVEELIKLAMIERGFDNDKLREAKNGL